MAVMVVVVVDEVEVAGCWLSAGMMCPGAGGDSEFGLCHSARPLWLRPSASDSHFGHNDHVRRASTGLATNAMTYAKLKSVTSPIVAL